MVTKLARQWLPLPSPLLLLLLLLPLRSARSRFVPHLRRRSSFVD